MLTEIAQHLTARMVDNFDTCPLIYDNLHEGDMTDTPLWGRFVIHAGDARETWVSQDGTGVMRKIRVHLQIFAKRDSGTLNLFSVADEFAAIFDRYQYHCDDFTLRSRMSEVMGRDRDDLFEQLNVSILIEAHYLAPAI